MKTNLADLRMKPTPGCAYVKGLGFRVPASFPRSGFVFRLKVVKEPEKLRQPLDYSQRIRQVWRGESCLAGGVGKSAESRGGIAGVETITGAAGFSITLTATPVGLPVDFLAPVRWSRHPP